MRRLPIILAALIFVDCGCSAGPDMSPSPSEAPPAEVTTPSPHEPTESVTCDPGPVFTIAELEPPTWATEQTPSPSDVTTF